MLVVCLRDYLYATLLFNWLISKQLWKPFRRSLEKIRGAELQKDGSGVHFETPTQKNSTS
jgi:hypothetical protein